MPVVGWVISCLDARRVQLDEELARRRVSRRCCAASVLSPESRAADSADSRRDREVHANVDSLPGSEPNRKRRPVIADGITRTK